MRAWRLLAAVVAVAAVFAVACNDDGDDGDGDETPSATEDAVEGAQTVTIQVDGDGEDFNAYMIAFFPNEVTLHPGDTVRYRLEDSGEPHTVSGGGPVTALFDFIEETCGPEGFAAPQCAEDAAIPPETQAEFDTLFAAVPPLLPDGPGDANQTAANPCFLATGTLPEDEPCPEVDQPDFTGTEEFYNSGWMAEDFVMTLADDIAPGTYSFICLLHGPEMTSTINVVEESADADTADEVEARLDEELGEFQTDLAGPAAELQAFAGEDLGGVQVDVQADAFGEVPAGVAEFGPTEITVPAGGSVSWLVNGFHTVSFNVTEDLSTIRTVADDGTIHLNEPATLAAQVTPPDPPAEEPVEGAPPPVFDGGTWDGEGFLSTGGIGDVVFTLAFSTAGTYEYACVIHPDMEGTVTVE